MLKGKSSFKIMLEYC